jgi:hypothetical protein
MQQRPLDTSDTEFGIEHGAVVGAHLAGGRRVPFGTRRPVGVGPPSLLVLRVWIRSNAPRQPTRTSVTSAAIAEAYLAPTWWKPTSLVSCERASDSAQA